MVSKARRIFFQLLTVAVVGMAIFFAWLERHLVESPEPTRMQNAMGALEEKTLQLQSEILVGFMRYADGPLKTLMSPKEVAESRDSFRNMFIKSSLHDLGKLSAQGEDGGLALVRRQIVIADYLEAEAELTRLRANLQALADKSDDPALDQLLLTPPQKLTRNEVEILEEQLQWFGALYAVNRTQQPKLQAALAERAYTPPLDYFQRFAVALVLGLLIGSVSLTLFAGFLVQLVRRRLRFQYQPGGMPADYALEIFALYLLAMVCGSKVVTALATNSSIQRMLQSNLLLIGGMLLILFWPLFFGNSLGAMRERLGLTFHSLRRTLVDVLSAPLIYVGGLSLLIFVLVIYSTLLFGAGIDVSGGAHPIVPVLMGSEGKSAISGIVLLAVLFAPVVEEIMFRGAFYSWLRERLSAFPAMLFSALVFAAVHPQGAIGIIPLGTIGFILAFVREWRGNLTSCVLVHGCFNAGTLALILLFYR